MRKRKRKRHRGGDGRIVEDREGRSGKGMKDHQSFYYEMWTCGTKK